MTSNDNDNDNSEITSKEIVRLLKKIEDVQSDINIIKTEIQQEESLLVKLDEEYGSEITRIKKEFARMKERSFEEATEISNQAKVGALKEVLPITDNYFRAKSVFEPLTTDDEKFVAKTYDDVFSAFSKVIEDFGVTRVVSIGQPFDFNFMEAIMTQPSTEYPADIVCVEYQVGYKIGDKCIRPSMVVVSAGPGPSK
jgi:molecular chaperone GrpE